MGIDILTLAAARAGKGSGGSASKYKQPEWGAEEVVLLPETELAFAMNDDLGMDCAFVELSQALAADASYTINFNGAVYNCKSTAAEDGSIVVGNATALGGAGNDEPFMLLDMGGMNIVIPLDGSASATMSVAISDVHKIPAAYVETLRVKLDEDFTPDKTYMEVSTALASGCFVYIEYAALENYRLLMYPAEHIIGGNVVFREFNGSRSISLLSDGTVAKQGF